MAWTLPRDRHFEGKAMSAPPESVTDPNRSLDVLVVDDDEAMRTTSAAILRQSGYTVAVAPDGDVALQFLEHHPVGMVLLDIRMPRRDGLSVLDSLTTPQLVVLVSAHTLEEAAHARVDAKVVTFLEKPIPPERLLDTVASTLAHNGVDSG